MDLNKKSFLRHFTPAKIAIPVAIGLGVVAYMIYRDPAAQDFSRLLDAKLHWIFITFAVLVVRDFGYMYRIRHITGRFLSWKQSVDVIMLWEFASCVMPSVVGGSTIATFLLHKEGIKLGKSLAYVIVTAMLDNWYFVIVAPIILYFAKGQIFPDVEGLNFSVSSGLEYALLISYLLITAYAIIMTYALFVNPNGVKRLLIRIFSIGFLKRWRTGAFRHGNELVWASHEIKGHSYGYWVKAILSTAFVWTARYYLINCLIAAFTDIDFHDHLLLFARNFVYKVVLMVAVTPGGAGIAEVAFPTFFGSYLGGFTAIIVLLYRIVTYYLYLILGSFFLPRWVKRVFSEEHETAVAQKAVEIR
ncbi:flippase-like domain-containing protein [Adhaeribacter sp. BT258]|uniref:Flippase-like domain-containing protein n=1 Tax=Adhaeribacter terrigena TaxID=2793070 RepID=A0ABS1BXC2_9BACT|nr:lysylphosphatidylglycerol synthase transmembrane domain-containing protein [Adhaeribacter terrigena]MBK0401527.1 flippase-like domain-containing protein [Adhaeribacter terrigena]